MTPEFRSFLREGEQAGQRYCLDLPRQTGAAAAGSRLGQRPGRSLDFRDFRDYQPGDDLRWIDWGIFARTDRLTVRLFHEEVAPHLDILLDGSRSMDLPESAKARCALGLAAALAAAAANRRCTHGCAIAADGILPVANAAQPPSLWDGIAFDSAHTVEQAFGLLPPAFRRQGIRVLISDLLWPGDPLPALQRLADGAAAVLVVQVLARAEAEPPEEGNVRLVDAETGEMLEAFVDAAAARRYADALGRHYQHWERACRRLGAGLVRLLAEDVVGSWDLAALQEAELLTVQ